MFKSLSLHVRAETRETMEVHSQVRWVASWYSCGAPPKCTQQLQWLLSTLMCEDINVDKPSCFMYKVTRSFKIR